MVIVTQGEIYRPCFKATSGITAPCNSPREIITEKVAQGIFGFACESGVRKNTDLYQCTYLTTASGSLCW